MPGGRRNQPEVFRSAFVEYGLSISPSSKIDKPWNNKGFAQLQG